MKSLKELKGAKLISKKEQQAIIGGLACDAYDNSCPPESYCCVWLCRAIGTSCPH